MKAFILLCVCIFIVTQASAEDGDRLTGDQKGVQTGDQKGVQTGDQTGGKLNERKDLPSAPLLIPIRSINCGSFSQNIRDYITNYDYLITGISWVESRESPAIRRLKNHNQNVLRAMNDMRRYNDYNRRLNNDRSKTPEQRQKILTDQNAAIKTANEKYSETSKIYQTKIDEFVKKLDPTSTMQECQRIVDSAVLAQSLIASKLMMLPDQMCAEFKSAYATFEKELHAAYTLIGAPIPR